MSMKPVYVYASLASVEDLGQDTSNVDRAAVDQVLRVAKRKYQPTVQPERFDRCTYHERPVIACLSLTLIP